VPQCESCKCIWGTGDFCGDVVPLYLDGMGCTTGVLYRCQAKDLQATDLGHCAEDCIKSTIPGKDHCPGGF